MTYVRWEYHESITVSYESRGVAPPARALNQITELSHPTVEIPGDANRLLWVAPMALAAGAAIVREANRRRVLPRLYAAARHLALARSHMATLPENAPDLLGPGQGP